jgi:energy-converting hydrogenase B subunit D
MTLLQLLCYGFTAIGATLVVLTREPRRQVLLLSLYGIVLTVLFMALRAPDVAFSELAVGTVAMPLMLLVTLAGTSRHRRADEKSDDATAPEDSSP